MEVLAVALAQIHIRLGLLAVPQDVMEVTEDFYLLLFQIQQEERDKVQQLENLENREILCMQAAVLALTYKEEVQVQLVLMEVDRMEIMEKMVPIVDHITMLDVPVVVDMAAAVAADCREAMDLLV